MKLRVRLALATTLLLAAAIACSSEHPEAASDGTWVGTITTEGNVTTVVNESGSVWGGTATLVEEASIGVESGAEEYMLGSVGGLWATDDEIYVIDAQLPAVRVYDYGGRYVRDIGSAGQGPGEYLHPRGVYVDPAGLVYVHDGSAERLNVYEADGDLVNTWTTAQGPRLLSQTLTFTLDGRFFARVNRWPDPTDRETIERFQQEVGPEGPIGEELPLPVLDFEPLTLTVEVPGRTATWGVPYLPYQVWAFLPTGEWITGVPDAYHFEIHHADGAVTRVQKYWDPVPIPDDEAEHEKRWTTAVIRRQAPDFEWNGPQVPEFKPAYRRFTPTFGNRVLVAREGPSHRVDPCDERYEDRGTSTEPCYVPERTWDMFELEGRYLGEVTRPAGRLSRLFFRGDVALVGVEDDAGTIMVKRYRLVLPGEG